MLIKMSVNIEVKIAECSKLRKKLLKEKGTLLAHFSRY